MSEEDNFKKISPNSIVFLNKRKILAFSKKPWYSRSMEKYENSKNSTVIAEMKLIAHGAEGFLLFPSRAKISEAEQLQALHTHLYYEFFFAQSSPVVIVTETGTTSFTNGVVIVPPGLKHFSCAEGGGYRITVTKQGVKRMDGKAGFLELLKKDGITELAMSEEGAFYLQKLVVADFFSVRGKVKGEALLRLLFLEIASTLERKEDTRVLTSVNDRYRNVEKIDKYVGSNYNRADASVEDLAKALCLSVRQTSRIIKKEYGRSFVSLMNDKKMAVAEILLKNSAMPVSEIIHELNFETENYFYRLFKKYYGMSPLKYRKLSVKNSSE